jgi:ribonuclease HI
MPRVTTDDDDLALVVRLERRLLDPAVRADTEQVGLLLHPEFSEVGRSGRVWDRASTLAALVQDPAVSQEHTDFVAHRISADVVLVRFRGTDGTQRSSWWVRDAALGWVIRYHQGTPPPAGEAP